MKEFSFMATDIVALAVCEAVRSELLAKQQERLKRWDEAIVQLLQASVNNCHHMHRSVKG